MSKLAHAGRLRVVDEPHAVDLGDQFHRVLEAAKSIHRARHRIRRDAGNGPDGCRRYHVVDQMWTKQMDRAQWHQLLRSAAVMPRDNPAVLDYGAVENRARAGEVALLRACE